METVAVAFGSAILGGMLGFFGAVWIERSRVNRNRIGMMKALLGELRRNGSVIDDELSVGPSAHSSLYSTGTWEAARFELAQFLPTDLYDVLLGYYEDVIPRFKRMSEGRASVKEWTEQEEIVFRMARETTNTAIAELQTLPEAGSFRNRWPTAAKWTSKQMMQALGPNESYGGSLVRRNPTLEQQDKTEVTQP